MLSSSYNMWVEILNFVWFAAWFRDKTMSFNLLQIYVRKLHVSVILYVFTNQIYFYQNFCWKFKNLYEVK